MANLIEDEDDHFYGAWIGGSKAKGGHPEGEAPKGDAKAAFVDKDFVVVRMWQSTFSDVDLIQGHPEGEAAKAFASAVAKCPAVEGEVYRGIDMKGLVDKPDEIKAYWEKRVGKSVLFHEPVSTSPVPATALKYGEVLFHIAPRPGAARDISPLSNYPKFAEAILAPGRFRVDGVAEGPPRTDTLFGPLGSPRRTIAVLLTDITEGERTWLADGKGARP